MKHVEIQEFFVEGSNQQSSHVLLHITEPSTPHEEKRGYFFAIVEINYGEIEHIEMMQQIIDDIESIYYEDSKNTKKQFEIALEYVNRRSNELLSEDNIDIHAVVGVLDGYDLFLSYRGGITSFITFKQKDKLLSINITEERNLEDEATKIFPNLIEGTIKPSDYLYLGSPFVEEYISTERIEKLLISRSLKQVSEHIEKVLTGLNKTLSFGGILLHTLPQKKKSIPQTIHSRGKQSISEQSLNELITAKQNTQETLSPPLFKEFSKQIKAIRKKKNSKHNYTKRGKVETNYRAREIQEKIPDEGMANRMLIITGRILVTIVLNIWKVISTISMAISKFFIAIFLVTTNKNNNRNEVLSLYKKFFSNIIKKIGALPMATKLLFLLMIISIVIFTMSIGASRVQTHYQLKEQAYTLLLADINDKKDDAQARLIYDNGKESLTLLNEINELIDTLPQETKAQKETFASLKNEVKVDLSKLRKVELKVSEVVAQLEDISIKPTHIAKIGSQLVTYSTDNKKIVAINTINKSVTSASNEAVSNLLISSTPKEDDEIIFLSKTNSAASYKDKSGVLLSLDIDYPKNDVSVVGATVYNTRLYTLDKANNSIYKHNRTQTGFDRGTNWNKDDADFSKTTAMTIDGKIYTLNADGTLQVFERGRLVDFVLQKVEPTITQATQIWTYADVNFIYLFEPKQKRIIKYNKQGTLIKQITSDQWSNPTSMVIDATLDIAYVLDGTTIYKVSTK